jgi:peptidoglycan/LPS O-acetylase OafA/YrhL
VRFVLHTRFGDSPRLELVSAPFALAISFAIAKLSWKFLESPLIRRVRRFTYWRLLFCAVFPAVFPLG